MKKIHAIILFFCFFSFHQLYSQENIYITLDTSGSMHGTKYKLANYSAQVISVLNIDNKVSLIVGANENNLSGKKAYTRIQVSNEDLDNLEKKFRGTEIADVENFNSVFKKNSHKQSVFLIGDGHWSRDSNIESDFKNHALSTDLQVIFLEVLESKNEKSDFENFLNENNIGKIYKADSERSIIDAINKIAEELTGVSSLPTNRIKESGNCITFKTDFNLKEIKFLYQDSKKLKSIPEISSIEVNGKALKFNNIGNPSNEKLFGLLNSILDGSEGLLSSRIYSLKESIGAESEIKVCFRGKFDKENLKIFPITDIHIGDFKVITEGNESIEIDSNSIGVCKDNEHAEVSIDFSQKGTKLTGGTISSTKVSVISEGKTYNAKFSNGKFLANIPLVGDTTTYRFESHLPGYFTKNSGLKKIIKTDNCEPKIEKKVLPPIKLNPIDIKMLMQENRIKASIVDDNGVTLNPEHFDIEVTHHYPLLFKKLEVNVIDDKTFEIILTPRGQWCECFVPDQLELDLTSEAKNNQPIDGIMYTSLETKFIADVFKGNTWLDRCKWIVFSMIASLLLIWYLLRISRKKRFRKGAKVVFEYPDMISRKSLNPKYISSDFRLRKKGFLAWLNRWFNPFGKEKRNLNFEGINLSMLFTASKSIKYVLFNKASFDEDRMSCVNYDADSKSEYVKFDESSDLVVKDNPKSFRSAQNKLGYTYPKNGWNDIATFRFVIGIFIFLLILYFLFSTYLLISSLF